jgi:selenide,water dikinase
MGGHPLTALAIAGFPLSDGPDAETVRAIFRGGYDKLREAGVSLLGGHTIQDPEIKFGYAVTGEIDPARVLRNSGARPGDVLLLTKPLGTGVITTALKFNRASEVSARAAVSSMITLNRVAAEVLADADPGHVHACTDITGFGLIGHACEMALASDASLEIGLSAVPFLEGAVELAQKNLPGGGRSNREHFAARVRVRADDPDRMALLYDPQTSGGLLAAMAPDAAGSTLERLRAAGLPAAQVGRVSHRSDMLVTID